MPWVFLELLFFSENFPFILDLRHELAVHHKSDDEVKSDGEKENLDIGKKRSSINFPTQNQDILQGSSTGDATNANKVEIGTANVVDNCMPNSEDMSRQRIASSTPVRSRKSNLCIMLLIPMFYDLWFNHWLNLLKLISFNDLGWLRWI